LTSIDDTKKFDIFMQLFQNEVNYHWTRNNFFLLMSSILLVALVQVKAEALVLSIGLVGLALNVMWLLIQFDSNAYIEYWAQQMEDLEKSGLPRLWPKGSRVPVRSIALVLPLPFIILWIVVTVLSLTGMNF